MSNLRKTSLSLNSSGLCDKAYETSIMKIEEKKI